MYRRRTAWLVATAMAMTLVAAGASAAQVPATADTGMSLVVTARVTRVLRCELTDEQRVTIHANVPWHLVWTGLEAVGPLEGEPTDGSGVRVAVPDGATGWSLVERP